MADSHMLYLYTDMLAGNNSILRSTSPIRITPLTITSRGGNPSCILPQWFKIHHGFISLGLDNACDN